MECVTMDSTVMNKFFIVSILELWEYVIKKLMEIFRESGFQKMRLWR